MQNVYNFVSYKRDHAAIWTFMEVVGNNVERISPTTLMQDRNGQYYLAYRNLFNTNEGADRQITADHYDDVPWINTITVFLHENSDPCKNGCINPAIHAEGGHDV